MNKTPIYIWLCISLFSLFLIQCDDKESDDLYKQYINEGEKIYLGKTDSLVALSGIGRVQLKWYVNADPKIEETVIYWNMRQDSVKKSFRRTEKGIQADSLFIEGLPEGTYTFELINRNKSGYRSLVSTVQGEVYGESFISGLKSRGISSMTVIAYDKEKQLSDIKISGAWYRESWLENHLCQWLYKYAKSAVRTLGFNQHNDHGCEKQVQSSRWHVGCFHALFFRKHRGYTENIIQTGATHYIHG